MPGKPAPWAAAVVSGLLGTTSLSAQKCGEPRYRWSMKVDTSISTDTRQTVTVPEILETWDVPPLSSRDRCAPRAGRERTVVTVSGWVRRIEKVKDDGDWHIELTDRQDDRPKSCVVVEIPLPRYGARYARAREALDRLVRRVALDAQGDLHPPVRIRVTGAPFFDGQHRVRVRNHPDRPDGGHGRCNSSLRSLWEIHPVYMVDSG